MEHDERQLVNAPNRGAQVEDLRQLGLKVGTKIENTIEQLKNQDMFGDEMICKFKGGNYYYMWMPNCKSWSVYKNDSNRIYKFYKNTNICKTTDALIDIEAKYTGKNPEIIQLDTVVVVNGISCRIVRVKNGFTRFDYFYNSEILKTNPDLFVNHSCDGWFEFLKISKSLPLRIDKTMTGSITIRLIMKEYKEEKIEDNIFFIPNLIFYSNIAPGRKAMTIKR